MTTGITPWTSVGGSAQCANYGTISVNSRLRGNLYFINWHGLPAAQFDDPLDPNPAVWTLENCQLTGPLSGSRTLVLPADDYIGMSVWVPSNSTVPNSNDTTELGEFHFENIGNQGPIQVYLHSNSIQVMITTGTYSSTTGFQYAAYGSVMHMPAMYAIPPGALTLGAWNDIVFHVHWTADSTGNFQFYYKTRGTTTWHAGASVSGIPTIAWNVGTTPSGRYIDAIGSYGRAFTQDYSVYMSSVLRGTSLAGVQSAMP